MKKTILTQHLLYTLLLLLSFLCGCVANGQLGKTPMIESDNFATIQIARPSGFTGCGTNTRIQIDYSDFYGLACGEKISFRVPAGKAVTISQTTSVSPDHIKIDPEKGESIYMVNDCIGFVGTCGLSEVDKGTFKRTAQKCEVEKKVGYDGESAR